LINCYILFYLNHFKYTVELMQSDTWVFRHPTKIYGPKVFLLTKIKPKYFDILYNPTYFPGSLVCRIRNVPLYICMMYSVCYIQCIWYLCFILSISALGRVYKSFWDFHISSFSSWFKRQLRNDTSIQVVNAGKSLIIICK